MNDTVSRIIEASIGIQDYGIKKGNINNRIIVKQFRKSSDYIEKSKTMAFFTKNIFGEQNNLYETYNSFDVENKELLGNIIKTCEFTFKIPTILDSNTVYVIRFDYPIKNESFKQYGYLYIQADNYAILQSEYYVIPGPNPWLRKLLEGRQYLKKVKKKFKKHKEKYYINYIYYYTGIIEDVKVDRKTFPKTENIILINNVTIKRRDYEKVKLRNMEKKDVTLYKEEFKYNPEFWKNYNIILANPIATKVIIELEKDKELETQFKENSKQ